MYSLGEFRDGLARLAAILRDCEVRFFLTEVRPRLPMAILAPRRMWTLWSIGRAPGGTAAISRPSCA